MTKKNQPTSKRSVDQVEEKIWDPDDPNEYPTNRPVKESIVENKNSNTLAVITDSDIKRVMTPEDRKIPENRPDQSQKTNERLKRK